MVDGFRPREKEPEAKQSESYPEAHPSGDREAFVIGHDG
jgi:hypothetical protein